MKTLRVVAPWIFWIVLLAALAVAGSRNNAAARGLANPRSFEQPPATETASEPCSSSGLREGVVRTSTAIQERPAEARTQASG